ncbi:MAG: hypothetical protein LBU18_05155 [Treponema sp.]|jgi:uncharacterized lipoprotein YehR (DUF1307 family)|nr:hypothetical protein [Treponema sp.]
MMMEKKKLLAAGAVAVLLALALAGCPNDTSESEEEDTWSKITGLSQVNGKWKGSYSQTQSALETFKEMYIDLNGRNNMPAFTATALENVKINYNTDITMSIDAEAQKTAQTGTMKITISADNDASMSTAWINLTSLYYSVGTADSKEHSITIPIDEPETSINEADFAEMLSAEINQHGTKIKIPATANNPEFLLIKQ